MFQENLDRHETVQDKISYLMMIIDQSDPERIKSYFKGCLTEPKQNFSLATLQSHTAETEHKFKKNE